MLRVQLLLGAVATVLWVFCVIDAIISREGDVRHLPKIAWIFVVLLFPLVGSIAWLAAGRPRAAHGRSRHERVMPAFPEYDRPGRAAASTPEADEEFLHRLRERAEEQRRKAREERQRQDREEHDEPGDEPVGG